MVSKTQKQLSSDIFSPIFLPDSNRIIYLKFEDSGLTTKLYSSNPDGGDESLILTYPGINQDRLVYEGNNKLVSYSNPDGFGRNYLYEVSLVDKTVKQLTTGGLDFRAKVSPLGDKVITQTVYISNSPTYKFFLSLVDLNTKAYAKLGVEADIKLSNWSPDGNFIYALTTNGLWVVDAQSFSKTLLPLPSGLKGLELDSENGILVAPDNHSIFFTSDHLLYKLSF